MVIDIHQILINPIKLIFIFNINGHAANGVYHGNHGSKINGHIIGDGSIKILVDGFKRQLGAAKGIGSVELVIAVIFIDVYIGIPH